MNWGLNCIAHHGEVLVSYSKTRDNFALLLLHLHHFSHVVPDAAWATKLYKCVSLSPKQFQWLHTSLQHTDPVRSNTLV